MSSRIHQIQLSEALEKQLHDRAAAAGTDAETFIVKTIEEKLQAPRSFKEIFAPLHEAFADGSDAPDAIEKTLEQVRDSVHQSRRTKTS